MRSVRSVLREVLYLAIKAEKRRLAKLQDLYGYKKGELTPSQYKRKVFILRMRQALDYVLEKSTCICDFNSTCSSYKEICQKAIPIDLSNESAGYLGFLDLARYIDKKWNPENPFDIDMAWDPIKKAWYCEKCFDEIIIPEYIKNEGRLIDYIPPPMDETEWHIVDNQILPLHEHPKKREPDMDEYIKYYFVDRNRRWEDYIKDNPLW
ncbi:MAG: hypothetical protein ACTSRI_20550 [Promethearchaeota archaeon]